MALRAFSAALRGGIMTYIFTARRLSDGFNGYSGVSTAPKYAVVTLTPEPRHSSLSERENTFMNLFVFEYIPSAGHGSHAARDDMFSTYP